MISSNDNAGVTRNDNSMFKSEGKCRFVSDSHVSAGTLESKRVFSNVTGASTLSIMTTHGSRGKHLLFHLINRRQMSNNRKEKERLQKMRYP